MNDEDFLSILTEFAAAESSALPADSAGWLAKFPTEQKQAILARCLTHMHRYEANVTHRARRLTGALLRDGVSPAEKAVIDGVEAQLGMPHSNICLPTPEFVEWVERKRPGNDISPRFARAVR